MELFDDGLQLESPSGETANEDEYLHCCHECGKIVLNLNHDDKMSTESNYAVNVHLGATLDDLLGTLERGCKFADYTLRGIVGGIPTRTDSNLNWEPCAELQDHKQGHDHSDRMKYLGFWNQSLHS